MQYIRLCLIACLLALPSLAQAQNGFKTPSGNIFCQSYQTGDSSEAELRCDMAERDNATPAAPADCELDWGNAFGLGVFEGKAYRICAGDSVIDSSLPTLPYGESWEDGDYFQCTSAREGLKCINQFGNGFFLSRKSQRLY